ncbi:N-acetylornithine carbamoyltransferase [Sediminitomix flava]|uniref:N-succinylornithine carbamoyltransferase n=1 Tax=Sediminitomix flava TaxID=379075 RepID=A0A315ZUK7_SEDFL|nr:N-acetylornithine carbamoyltransferase [Sediminitomix flava]PWJ39329.1 N-succinyl-L-ornithine transcarbamylase [Sediminitomix flava]
MKKYTTAYDVPNINDFADKALELKKNPFAFDTLGKHKTLGLIFFNPSLRTRLSTQKAAMSLGMNVIVMNVDGDGWKLETEEGVIMDSDKAEHIKDAFPVIGQYCDIIGVRSFPSLKDREADYADKVINDIVKYTSVPVVSLESAIRHPLQALADLMTIKELSQKAKPKVVLTWAPHPRALPQAVSNSFAETMNLADVELVITHPKGYELNPEFVGNARVVYDQKEAFKDADFIYAKNWSSYNDYGQILSQDKSWVVDEEKMALTNNAHFMHCLPVRRNVIVTDGVIDSPQSAVIQQAGNREFAVQTVLKEMLENL